MSHDASTQSPALSWFNRTYPGLTRAGRSGLAALIDDPARSLIALDFDGTLAPIVPDPEQARALPAAVTALRELTPLVGTMAVVTGRPARTAVDYASLRQVPGVVVLGHYGRQRWSDGRLDTPPPPEGLAVAKERLPSVLAAANAPDGTWIEDKGDAVAVHTRRAADPAAALEQVSAPLSRLAADTGLRAEPGRLVIELRPDGSDKGTALTALAAERARSAVLYCGDDLGDRPAFAAIRRLRAGGLPGIAVCSGSAEVADLAAEADLVVDGPEGVARLLAAIAVIVS
ncbi:MAG TPA: trehalose-phosphatase [Streptosporangiaceae bacterium]